MRMITSSRSRGSSRPWHSSARSCWLTALAMFGFVSAILNTDSSASVAGRSAALARLGPRRSAIERSAPPRLRSCIHRQDPLCGSRHQHTVHRRSASPSPAIVRTAARACRATRLAAGQLGERVAAGGEDVERLAVGRVRRRRARRGCAAPCRRCGRGGSRASPAEPRVPATTMRAAGRGRARRPGRARRAPSRSRRRRCRRRPPVASRSALDRDRASATSTARSAPKSRASASRPASRGPTPVTITKPAPASLAATHADRPRMPGPSTATTSPRLRAGHGDRPADAGAERVEHGGQRPGPAGRAPAAASSPAGGTGASA